MGGQGTRSFADCADRKQRGKEGEERRERKRRGGGGGREDEIEGRGRERERKRKKGGVLFVGVVFFFLFPPLEKERKKSSFLSVSPFFLPLHVLLITRVNSTHCQVLNSSLDHSKGVGLRGLVKAMTALFWRQAHAQACSYHSASLHTGMILVREVSKVI